MRGLADVADVCIFFGFIVFCITSFVLGLFLVLEIIQFVRSGLGLKTDKLEEVDDMSKEENVPYPKYVRLFHLYLYDNGSSNSLRNLLLIFCSSLLMMILGTLIKILENI